MIISKIFSGLGNQLFQYAVGREIAIKINTDLKLDTSFFPLQNLRANKLQHFNIKASIATEAEVEAFLKPYKSSATPYKFFRKINYFIPRHKQKFFKEQQDWIFDDQLYKVSSNTYIDGYWQNYKYFEDLDKSIISELTLNVEPTPNYDLLKQQLFEDTNSVAVHIRRGDYITDKQANQLMGIMPQAYYEKAIALMRSKYNAAKFYFFSDDLDWVKKNFKHNDFKYVDGGTDYFDLALMSCCQNNIIANSSFSWWGAFLNQNPTKTVIAPKQWVVPNEINDQIEIIFPSWIKI